jgi:hypothetical protein
MRKGPPQSLDSFLVRSLLTLMIPQGYTLSIAGSFAIAVNRYGFPFDLNAWGFVAGAVAAFVALAVLARGSLSGDIAALPMGFRALINIVPLVVVLIVAGVVAVISSPAVGFPLSGFVGAGGYVVLLSIFLWLVAVAEAR